MIRTADGRVDVAPAAFVDDARRQLAAPPAPSSNYPMRLISRRRKEVMNSWLNEAPTIHSRVPANSVEINRRDAEELGITDGMPVVIESATASVIASASVSDAPRPGVLVCEHGFGSELLDPTGA